jgi:uncharacterized protein
MEAPHMECPIDKSTLQMTERAGIEIDYCPECRGVWLDRGELDKIIEKSEQLQDAAQLTRKVDDEHSNREYDARDKPRKSKRSSLIGDLFGGFGSED